MRYYAIPLAIAGGLTAGAPVLAQLSNWAAAVDGNWNDPARWDSGNAPDNIGEQASLGFNTAYTVIYNLTAPLGGLAIPNALATLDIAPGQSLLAAGDIVNNGTIRINPGKDANDARIRFDVSGTISGTGSLILFANQDDLNDAQILPNGTNLFQGADHSIRGTGTVRGLVNYGTVRADVPAEVLRIFSSDHSNYGLFAATGGGILGLESTHIFQGDSGVILAQDHSRIDIFGATVEGGEINAEGSGRTVVYTTSTFDGVTSNGPVDISPRVHLIVVHGLTNNGVITVNPDIDVDTVMRFDYNGVLDGSGEILLRADQDEVDDAQIFFNNGPALSQGAGHTIRGTGTIYGGFVNNGSVLADSPSRVLLLDSALDFGAKINNSLYAATNGGILRLASVDIDQGPDGLILAQEASQVALSGAAIVGGTVDSEGSGLILVNATTTFKGVTSNGTLHVSPGASLLVNNGLTNDGVIIVNPTFSPDNAHIRVDSAGDLAGAGEIILRATDNNLGDAKLIGNGVTVTLGPDQTLRGTGLLSGSIINNGTLAPGEPIGRFQVNGTLTLVDTSAYDTEVAGTNAGQFDTINVSDTAILGGALNITLMDGYIPDTCVTIRVLTAGAVEGAFDSVNGDAGNGRGWRVVYSAKKVEAIVACYADMEPDCALDLFDFLAFLVAFNADDPAADCTADQTLDLFDFLCFTNAFNQGCS